MMFANDIGIGLRLRSMMIQKNTGTGKLVQAKLRGSCVPVFYCNGLEENRGRELPPAVLASQIELLEVIIVCQA